MDSSNKAPRPGFQLQKLRRVLYMAIKNHVHVFTLPDSDLDSTSSDLPQSNGIEFQRGARRQLRYFVKDMLHRRYPFFFKEEITMINRLVTKRSSLKRLLKKTKSKPPFDYKPSRNSPNDLFYHLAIHIRQNGLGGAKEWTENNFGPLVDVLAAVYASREQKHRIGDMKCSASVEIHPGPVKSSRTEETMARLTFPSSSLATIPSTSSPDGKATSPEPQKPQELLSPPQLPAGPTSSSAADRLIAALSPLDPKSNEPETRLAPEHEDGQNGSTATSPPPSLHPIDFHVDSTISVPLYSRPTISTLRMSSSAAFSSAMSFLAEAWSSDEKTVSLSTRRRLVVLRLWLRRMRWAIKTVKYVRGARKLLMRK